MNKMKLWRIGKELRQNIIGGNTTVVIDFGIQETCCKCGKPLEIGDWVRLEKEGTLSTGQLEPQFSGAIYCFDCGNEENIKGTLAQVINANNSSEDKEN